MPQLYAALTDLVLPEADPETPLPRLPVLERLLARARRGPAAPDWRRWALAIAGLEAPAGDLPIGRTLARRYAQDGAPDATWFVATPVQLVASLTRVHFHRDGALELPPGAAAELVQRFARDWHDPALALVPAGDTLLLRVAGRWQVESQDPAPHAGAPLGPALPTGADASRLTRLMTELQMWLHADPPRAADGRALNGLWLWGGGHTELSGSGRWPTLAGAADAFLAALVGEATTLADARLESWSIAALARSGQDFAAADRVWFEPLAAALAGGRLARAELYLAGHRYQLSPLQRLRVWRRGRAWWELAR